ncbi:uncharacterized protein LOC128501828 [Spea bombifrons]|uniref:uncharacterized protein LOC128501828 n=1 Tax=Spea bombifrons TaxID=233779 RepID=UPI00234B850C|nr:uncharacterized protein LOC128501828 [Spea bombifrons]
MELTPDFDGLGAIDSLSAEQVGDLAFSGDVLNNESSAGVLVNSLDRRPFNQMDSFLTSFEANAEQRGMVSVANTNIRSSMLNVIYGKLSSHFHSFTIEQWRDVFLFKLRFFLGSITESQIDLLPGNIDCDVFQIIVSALDRHYQDLSPGARQAFYQKAKAYLLAKKQGTESACGAKTSGSVGWLLANLGSFRALASYQDIISLKPDFMFTDAVLILNEKQLASYSVESDALRDKDKIAKVFTGVSNLDLGAFLDAFNLAAEEKQLTQLPSSEVRKFFIGEVFCQLGRRFSLFTTADFTNWLQVKLKLFTSGLNAKTLGFIPVDISCDSLAAIIQVLSNVQNLEFSEDIYTFLQSVLESQLKNSGSACTSAELSDREWLLKYFGKFSTYAKWSEIVALHPTFQGLNTADLLTDTQLASASVSTFIISNVTAINDLFLSISGDSDFLLNFLGSLGDFVLKDSSLLANTKVRDAILMNTAEIVFVDFNTYSLAKVQNWMTTISFLLPGINATMLDFISLDLPCAYYQVVIHALDKVFPSLTSNKKNEVANFAKKYLAHQQRENDNICLPASGEVIEWINNLLGRFCRVLTVSDIQTFYPDLDTVSYTRVCVLS